MSGSILLGPLSSRLFPMQSFWPLQDITPLIPSAHHHHQWVLVHMVTYRKPPCASPPLASNTHLPTPDSSMSPAFPLPDLDCCSFSSGISPTSNSKFLLFLKTLLSPQLSFASSPTRRIRGGLWTSGITATSHGRQEEDRRL